LSAGPALRGSGYPPRPLGQFLDGRLGTGCSDTFREHRTIAEVIAEERSMTADAFSLPIRAIGRLEAPEHPAPEGDPEMGFAILAWLALLYLFSSKPGWFARLLVLLLVSILVAGCG
jgi:hypothetical protein